MASKRQAESDEVSSVDSLPQNGQTSDIPPKSKLRKASVPIANSVNIRIKLLESFMTIAYMTKIVLFSHEQ